MAETSKIYSALSAIMSECPAISKSQKNQQQGFMYRGVDIVMNVLQPLMIKHKVFAVPEVLDSQRQERVTAKGGTLNYTILRVKCTFYAEDGSRSFRVRAWTARTSPAIRLCRWHSSTRASRCCAFPRRK